jgi:hypothetical protein
MGFRSFFKELFGRKELWPQDRTFGDTSRRSTYDEGRAKPETGLRPRADNVAPPSMAHGVPIERGDRSDPARKDPTESDHD